MTKQFYKIICGGQFKMINGELLQKLLIFQYAIISMVYLYEVNYFKSMYWVGAIVITISILYMKQ